MNSLILTLADVNIYWHIIPLSLVVSLVYSASRYELSDRIVRRSVRLFFTIVIFMAVVLGVLWALSYNL